MLGNRYLISDYECDSCNEYFSVLENDLANFLGLLRTIHNVKGKEKVPTFKSADGEIEAKKEEFYGVTDGIKIARTGTDDTSFRLNQETGAVEITYTKHAYTPVKVYKILLKIALSVLTDEDSADYVRLSRLLLNDPENKLAHFAQVSIAHSAYDATTPWCYVFRKQEYSVNTPMHIVALYFQSYIFQIFVPLNEQDIKSGFYQGSPLIFCQCPPLYVIDLDEQLAQQCTVGWRDFSGVEPIKEQEQLTLNTAVDSWKNTQVYDPATGEMTGATGRMPDIVKLYLSRSGELPNFPKPPLPEADRE